MNLSDVNFIIILLIFAGDIDAIVTAQGQRVERNDRVYFHVKNFFVDFDIGQASIQLENLFNGDKQLGENLSFCFNQEPKRARANLLLEHFLKSWKICSTHFKQELKKYQLGKNSFLPYNLKK